MELHGSDVVNMCQQQCPIHLKMNGVLVNQVPGQNWMDSHQNWVMLLQQNHQKIERSKEIDYEEVPPPKKKSIGPNHQIWWNIIQLICFVWIVCLVYIYIYIYLIILIYQNHKYYESQTYYKYYRVSLFC